MAFKTDERVYETWTGTGTGTITLAGAITGYQTFASITGIANGDRVPYTIEKPNAAEWETGIGTYNTGTLARTTILRSSNANAAVNFSSGTKNVFCQPPAAKMLLADHDGVVDMPGGKLKFPATQSPSSDPNVLDDFEKAGTWTPILGGTATYTNQNGFYTKVGNKVTIIGRLTVNVLGTGSTTAITGLPFVPGLSIGQTGAVGSWLNLAVAPVSLMVYVTASRGIEFVGATAATANNATAQPIFGNGADVWFTATYFV